ncbi:hypothetical protein N665_0560s0013 [Sinapis alba]|nr:hypothetical protein N665_0560s0013 [Sinapis alba]
MQEARSFSKKDSAFEAVQGRSERDRKLAASQQSPFQGNSTAKLIIPNTKVGHGYDPFALPDKQLSKALTEHLKKISSSGLVFWISLLRSRLNRRLSRRFIGIVPTFCPTIKIWGVDIDDIYAPVNFQNDHWIAIWISIPKRHIVVWDSIVKHISKAQLDEVMEPFLTMVPYLLVECASTDEAGIKYSLEPFTYEKPTVGVPQCIAGDYGVYALKYMECSALGYTLFPAAFCEKNVKHIREKMAHDIFHETPGFEGIEDKTAYYNDLDTYG